MNSNLYKKLVRVSKFCIYGIIVQLSVYTLAFAIGGKAQQKSVDEIYLDLSVSSPAMLDDIIEEVEKSSKFKFSYIDGNFASKKVQIKPGMSSLGELLRTISEQAELSFKRVDETIYIKKGKRDREALVEIIDESISVSGTVMDEDGSPLPGATVLEKGTTNGTTTDIDGSFKLDCSDDAILTVSFVGYQTLELPVNKRSVIDVQLELDLEQLEEVVVVGYGSQRKSDLTGAIGVVDGEDMKDNPVQDPLAALQGKVPGLQITSTSGTPGAGFDVRIRGLNSFGSSSSPLYVIDGVLASDISSINPSDIESVSVLKDASSSAIYGARAANGVIVITTKRGERGEKPQITFNTYTGIQQQSNLTVDLLNSKQWIELDKESYENAGIALPYSDADLVQYDGISTDWLDVVTQLGKVNFYDLSLNGGSDQSTYFFSANYRNEEGIIKSTSANRISLRLNSNHKITKFIELGESLNIYNRNILGNPNSSGIGGLPSTGGNNPYTRAIEKVPLSRPYEEDGSYGYIRNSTIEHRFLPPNVITNEYVNSTGVNGLIGNLFLNVNLLDGLKFTPRINLEYSMLNNSQFVPSVVIRDTESVAKNGVSKYNRSVVHWNSDYMLTYDKDFAGIHHISALLGYSQEEYSTENLGGTRYETPNNEIQYLNAGDASTSGNSNGISEWSFVSYIGRLNYSFKDRYLVQATVRRDGSSRFIEKNRWGVFPSYSAAWRISEEDFFEGIKPLVNQLKLRASYGSLGNANISNYPSYATLSSSAYVLNEQIVPTYTLSSAVNRDIVWETTKKLDIGLETSFFDNKMSLEVGYYKSNTYDLLYGEPIPWSAGKTSNPTVNGGEVENKGLEINLGYREVVGDFSYDVSVNFFRNKNKVVDLGGNNFRTSGLEVGQPIYSFFGYKSLGIIKNQETLDNYPQKTGASLGDIWVADVDGFDENGELTGVPDGVINVADRTFIGNKYPSFSYGFFGNVSYKNLSLSISLSGVHGVDLNTLGLGYFTGVSVNTTTRVLDRWQATKNPDGDMPRVTRSDPAANLTDMSSFWLSDASYLKVNNINLSYELPANLVKKIRSNRVEVYLSGQNLYTFTKFPGQEVDVLDGGQFNRPSTYLPTPRTFTMGLKVTF